MCLLLSFNETKVSIMDCFEINSVLLNKVGAEAIVSSRKRKNYNFHETLNDPINRMLNAVEPGSYVQPHKHQNPDKREVFLLLRGRMAVVFFNDEGAITSFSILDITNGNFGVEIPAGQWHTIVSLQTGTVVYEIKDGPYKQEDDKNFATWAPKEGDDSCGEYMDSLMAKMNSI